MNTNLSEAQTIAVEVAYALPDRQKIIALNLPLGVTAFEAVQRSGIVELFDGIDLEEAKMGVFGKAIKPREYLLREGDRVEIYRPLLVDPKAARKARAEKSSAQ